MAKSNTAKVKIVLIISVALNLLTFSYFTSRFIYYQYFSSKPDIVFAKKQKQQWATLLNMPVDTNAIIFLGTSLTQNFPLQLAFNNNDIKNAGLAWSQTKHTLLQIQQLAKKKPRKVFLETGINDFERYVNPDKVFGNFIKIAETLTTVSQRSKLYVQSILPTSNPGLNATIVAYNKRVNNYCRQHRITFINLYPLFLKGDKIDPALTVDGVHLSVEGYSAWKKSIKFYVAE